MKKIRKREIFILLITIMMVFLPTTVVYGQKVELSWWVEYTEPSTQEAITKTILEPFQQQYPNVRINMEPKAAGTDYIRVLTTALAAGAGPDIIDSFGPSYTRQYAKDGIILPLTKYSEQYKWDDRFFNWALNTSVYENDLYGIPVMYEALILWFNVDMFVGHGWKLPKSWDELTALCEQVQGQGIMPFVHGGADCQVCTGEWWYSYALNAYAGPDNVYQALTGKKAWTDKVFAEAFERAKDMWQQGWITNKEDRSLTTTDAWGLFADQKGAMKVEGTWAFQYVDEYIKDFTWATSILPSWREGVEPNYPVGVGSNICINKNTNYPDEAAIFLNFISEDPKRVGEMIANVRGEFWVPIELSMDDFPPGVDSRLTRVFTTLSEVEKTGNYGYVAWTYWPPKTNTYLWQNFSSILDGSLVIEDYLKEADRLFKEEMEAGLVPLVAAR